MFVILWLLAASVLVVFGNVNNNELLVGIGAVLIMMLSMVSGM